MARMVILGRRRKRSGFRGARQGQGLRGLPLRQREAQGRIRRDAQEVGHPLRGGRPQRGKGSRRRRGGEEPRHTFHRAHGQGLREHGIHIISEIEFAARYDSARKICVTGSNGKTTTTSLIHYLLCEAGLDAGLGGNIGKSYAPPGSNREARLLCAGNQQFPA